MKYSKKRSSLHFLGKTETYVSDALVEVKNFVQKILPALEKSVSW